MSAAATLLRLAGFAVFTAGLLKAALTLVPGTDLNIQSRSLVFVFAAPWLTALLVVRPACLLRALAAMLTGRGDEGLATSRTLDLVAGLTMAVGAIGMIGSFLTSQQHIHLLSGMPRREQLVPGIVCAMAVPALFALVVRFVLHEPLIVAIRRRHAPEGEAAEGRPRFHVAWKVILVAAATVLAVEGFHAAFLQPAVEAPRDTSFVAVGSDPTTGKQSPALRPDAPTMGKPIRVELARQGDGVICRVDGKTLTALPGPTDELRERVRALATDGTSRRVEIEAGPKVPFLHLVAAVDACIRATKQDEPYYRTGDEEREEVGARKTGPVAGRTPPIYQRVRVLFPTAEALVVPLELRFVLERYEHERLVILGLPWIDNVETVTVDAEGAPLAINVLWDAETKTAETFIRRDVMNRDELRARIRPRADASRDLNTGVSEAEFLLRCDRGVPVGAVWSILTLLASEPCKVGRVLVSGRRRWEGEH